MEQYPGEISFIFLSTLKTVLGRLLGNAWLARTFLVAQSAVHAPLPSFKRLESTSYVD
jgi:hypothetical protein